MLDFLLMSKHLECPGLQANSFATLLYRWIRAQENVTNHDAEPVLAKTGICWRRRLQTFIIKSKDVEPLKYVFIGNILRYTLLWYKLVPNPNTKLNKTTLRDFQNEGLKILSLIIKLFWVLFCEPPRLHCQGHWINKII